MANKKVVIIGCGFGGLEAAKLLAKGNFDIVIIDKTNYHLFQPLLYQVATAALSPADIAIPIRSIFSKRKNVQVIMEKAVSIDRESKTVHFENYQITYDYLIVATGTMHSYFGHGEWEQFAPGLKDLKDAIGIREKILESLELAEKIADEKERQKYLNFVIVGGGPTGVELAGAIAEIAKKTMMNDFRNFSTEDTRVYLIEGLPRILSTYPEILSEKAKKSLENLGVEVILNERVVGVTNEGVKFGNRYIESKNIIWAAGNEANKLLKTLNTELDRAGRIIVEKNLAVKGSKEVFVIGDAAVFKDEKGDYLPAVAQVAIQEGRFVAKLLLNDLNDMDKKIFKYIDKGSMATIGRARAIAVIKGLKLSGFIAWLSWSFIHILFLIGFRNRFRVMLEWAWYYIKYNHGIRLIVGRDN